MRKRTYYGAALLLALAVTGLAGCEDKDYKPIDIGAVVSTGEKTEGAEESGGADETSEDGGVAESGRAAGTDDTTGADGAAETGGTAESNAATSAGDLTEAAESLGTPEAGEPDSSRNETETMSPEPQASKIETSALNVELKTEPGITFETRDETVYVTGDNVNIRQAASSSGAVLTTAKRGTKLKRTGYSDTWSKLEMDGKVCYISSQYLSVKAPETTTAQSSNTTASAGEVKLDASWKYAEFSKINSGAAIMYRSEAAGRKGITVCVNAGHGTSGGASVKTLCHPDGTPKVTGGTTGAGATTAVAVSGGMTFSDGTPEAKVTLAMAKVLKDKLLAAGYDVLMIRESDDVQLDNIARTVIANNKADCHIALHWDSTTSNKGAFYMSVPNVASYRNMEPVASNWQKHNALGESLIAGLSGAGVKIWPSKAMEMDLTQTSYSTIPSIDIELGDKASDHSAATLEVLGKGLVAGVDKYFAGN